MWLQRGPGYFARESVHRWISLPDRSFTLQRGPGYFARERRSTAIHRITGPKSFKEAQAISPGKVFQQVVFPRLEPCFKEAQAISPGKGFRKQTASDEEQGASKRPRLFRPGKPSTSTTNTLNSGKLQRGPGYFARERWVEQDDHEEDLRCFKEAQAISPGKDILCEIATDTWDERFKEAQAISPGKETAGWKVGYPKTLLQRGPGYFARERSIAGMIRYHTITPLQRGPGYFARERRSGNVQAVPSPTSLQRGPGYFARESFDRQYVLWDPE